MPVAHTLRAAWIVLVKRIRDPGVVVAVKADIVKHHVALDDSRREIENAIVPYSTAKLAILVPGIIVLEMEFTFLITSLPNIQLKR